ncbi:MAG: polysaccharide deacetylase family protein [Culicoidibacterales bacterium]
MSFKNLKKILFILIALNLIVVGMSLSFLLVPKKQPELLSLKKQQGVISNSDFLFMETYRPSVINLAGGVAAKAIPILMYHDIISEALPEYDGNKMHVDTFKGQLKYLQEEGYRTITVDEFVSWYNNKIELPEKSILLTFDDGFRSIKELVEPALKEYKMHAVSFIIGEKLVEETYFINQVEINELAERNFVEFQSHSFGLHSSGSNGRGKIETVGIDDGVKDNELMIPIVGKSSIFCYPFGHNDGTAHQTLASAAIPFAVTTQQGFATRSTDALALPRVRMNDGVSIEQFKRNIALD